MKYAFLPAALIVTSSVAGPAAAQQPGTTRDKAIEQAGSRFADLDADSNGIVTAAEVSAFVEKRAEESGRPASPERAQRMFDGMDGDKDGKVTVEEARTAAAARFDRADVNKNGLIDADEGMGRGREGGGRRD
jgi:hypothetical protein